MSDLKDVSAEATDDGSIGVDGMTMWMVITVFGFCDDRLLFLLLSVLVFQGLYKCKKLDLKILKGFCGAILQF